MAYDKNNIFAKILRGEIPCNKIFEDDYALAFHDIAPKAPIHALVIPKGAYENLDIFTQTASDAEICGLMRAIGTVAAQLGISAGGWRALANCGFNGGQEVPHLHFHLFGGRRLGPMLAPLSDK